MKSHHSARTWATGTLDPVILHSVFESIAHQEKSHMNSVLTHKHVAYVYRHATHIATIDNPYSVARGW